MKLLEELHAQSGGGGGGGLAGGGGTSKAINSELWHACAGPLVSLPQPGSLVYYFPQGHIEQVSTTTKRVADAHIPCYPNLSSQMMCQVHKVTLHADKDTDEIYAQITLQPVNSEKDVFLIPDFGQSYSKQPKEFFCKTLTASDTSTHGGFSVPRRAAEKLFPPLDFSMQPPNQELVVKDLQDNTWTFRHIYRGQPKRNLLTTGWSVFVGSKRLKAGDSVLFIRDERSQLLLGVRRANRQQAMLPSSVLSADSMHIGVLAAAAHASANRIPFTIYYNPRACSSGFVVPLAKYHRAVYGTRISIGMRFGMMFEAEDSSKRRYTGTIMGISDNDPLRWPNSKWRNLQVEWDECGCIERPSRVSLWEIESPENLFIFSSPTSVLKRPYSSDLAVEGAKSMMKRSLQQIPESDSMKALPKPRIRNPDIQVGCYPPVYPPLVQNITKYGLPLTSTVLGCPNQGNQLLHDILSQTESQKESTSFPQQQVNPSGGHLEENSNTSNCKNIVSDLNSQVERPQDVRSDPSLGPNCDGQDGSFESKHNISGEGKVVDTEKDRANIASIEALVDMDENAEELPVPVLESESESKGQGKKQNCSAITDPTLLLERVFPSQVQKVDPNILQMPRDDAPLSDIADPNFSLHDRHHQSPHYNCYMDNLGWMVNSSCDQLFTQEEKMQPESLSSFGKVDMSSFYGSDNSRTTSADISAIINPEHISSTCTSEVSADQGLMRFSQDSLSNEMQHYPVIPSLLEGKSLSTTEECAPRLVSSSVHLVSIKGDAGAACSFPHPYELNSLLELGDAPDETLSKPHFQVGNGNIPPKKPNMDKSEDGFHAFGQSSLHAPTKGLSCNFSSRQDVRSQVNSSLTDFSQEPPDNSGGTTLCNIDVSDNSQLNKYPWKQVSPPMRTFTKVQKLGSVGRCIDVTQFRNYGELISAMACMFGLEDQLNDPRSSEWKLVYVDYENDVLLVGDDPWEEFVNCVRCIRILSPAEVQQMSREGLPIIDDQLLDEAKKGYPTEQNQFLDEDYMLCRGGT